MKQFFIKLLLLSVVLASFSWITNAQVKIGGNPAIPVHSSAILQLDDSTKGLLLPVLSTTYRNAIASPTNGLLIYNKTTGALNIFSAGSWKIINTDTSEWKFDTASKRVYLTKGLLVGDSTFYDTISHKFVFSDRRTYTSSLNQDIPADAYGGKYTFKATASKSSRDSATTATSALLAMYEIDNADTTYNNGLYNGITAITTVNPKAFQKPFQVTGISNSVLHAGNDTAFEFIGLNNTVYPNGVGYTDVMYGILNNTRLGPASSGKVGTMYGIYNISSRSGTSTSRINSNFYGYLGQLSSSLSTRIDGTSYGIYLSNAAGAAGGNYAIYTNLGRNRFGDSVLIGSGLVPRAFVDINNTTSMIIPTGTTLQRPASGVTGMLRFNTDNGGNLETYINLATGWAGTIRNTSIIDIPSLTAGTGYTVTLTINGATTGSSVSVSPTNAMANGLIISWARVSAANTVQVRFDLIYGGPVDPLAENYYIRVIQ